MDSSRPMLVISLSRARNCGSFGSISSKRATVCVASVVATCLACSSMGTIAAAFSGSTRSTAFGGASIVSGSGACWAWGAC